MEDQTSAATPTPAVHGLLERLLDEAEAQAPQVSRPPDPPPPSEARTGAADGPKPAEDSPAAGSPAAGSPAGNPLGALLSNPAVLSALPTLMENLTPLLGSNGGGGGGSPAVNRPHTVDRHTALLCALKPYLSPHRRETAETVIRLCRVWDALERSGISLTGLLGSLGGAGSAPNEGRGSDVQ